MSRRSQLRASLSGIGLSLFSAIAQLCVTGVPGICGWTGGLTGFDVSHSNFLDDAAAIWFLLNLAGLVLTPLWLLITWLIYRKRTGEMLDPERAQGLT